MKRLFLAIAIGCSCTGCGGGGKPAEPKITGGNVDSNLKQVNPNSQGSAPAGKVGAPAGGAQQPNSSAN